MSTRNKSTKKKLEELLASASPEEMAQAEDLEQIKEAIAGPGSVPHQPEPLRSVPAEPPSEAMLEAEREKMRAKFTAAGGKLDVGALFQELMAGVNLKDLAPRKTIRLTLYRDDSTAQVVYENVKTFFWTANNTVLTIAVYTGTGKDHNYIHWPRERFCWFKDERVTA